MELGLVQEIMRGRDGQTRAAIVKVASRDRQHSILKRPIQLLYPLEIQCESTETSCAKTTLDPESNESSPDGDIATLTEQIRPKRAAAKKADTVRREWIAELEKDD